MKIIRNVELSPAETSDSLKAKLIAHGFRVTVDEPGRLRGERGTKIAGLYSFDYKKLHTSIELRLSSAQCSLEFDLDTWMQYMTGAQIKEIEIELSQIAVTTKGPTTSADASAALVAGSPIMSIYAEDFTAVTTLIMAGASLVIIPSMGLAAFVISLMAFFYCSGQLSKKAKIIYVFAALVGFFSFALSSILMAQTKTAHAAGN